MRTGAVARVLVHTSIYPQFRARKRLLRRASITRRTMTELIERRWIWSVVTLLAVATSAALFFIGSQGGVAGFFGNLFKAYEPREFCMYYEPSVIGLHLVSDAAIAAAYYSIPLALIYFVHRRRDLSFSWIYVCFALFILACGTTHVMNIVALWYAPYRLDALVKFGTALVSVGTAVMLWPLIPKALSIPSPDALTRVNEDLRREVATRSAAEESLREVHSQLERRVAERTAELQAANAQLQAEIAARSAAEQARQDLLVREQQARADAERASRTKDEFLATLSHELRTPLGAISGWVNLLRQGGSSEDLQEGLRVIDRNTRVQTQLVEDLLDMSRIVSGKLRLDVQEVDLQRVIGVAMETVAPSAAAKGVELQRILDPKSPPVSGDPARLQQVIWNLLSNAIRFTPRGGRVRVQLERVNSHLELSVCDNGCGIAPDLLPHVFERFRQGDSSTTRQHGGLGLGLAIARHLVELHGGSIRAESAGEGSGATFLVCLPCRPVRQNELREHPVAETEISQSPSVRLDGMTVLVVDDEVDSREVVARILTRHGAKVLTAGTAEHALVAVQNHRPSVLVSDLGMPGEDGFSLIAKIRALAPDAGGLTPAVALTAFARTEDRMRALMAGFQMHLAKPVEPLELVVVLERLVTQNHGLGTRPPFA